MNDIINEELEEKVANGVKEFLRSSQEGFTIKEIYNASQFKGIEENNRMYLIRYFLDQFESIGMVDKIGHSYYYNP